MALTPEQVQTLKSQLLAQIQDLPEDKKAEAAAQIESLSPQALELMLKQQAKRAKSGDKEEGIFRLIIKGDIPSKKIDENTSCIAVLEINPVSKGHAIIIPIKAVTTIKEMPLPALALAKKISNRMISKLKAKSTEIQTETKLGEMIINVIPVYDKPVNLDSPRNKASNEELEDSEDKLKMRKKPKVEKIKVEKKTESKSQILKLPRKIP